MTDLDPISVDIAWEAIAKGNRQRVAKRGANSFMVKRDFDGSLKRSQEEFAERVRGRLTEDELARLPFKHPVKANFEFLYPVPSSWPAWKRRAALLPTEDPGRWHHESTPDLDNLEKFLGDTLSKVVYDDDRRIDNKHTVKRYWTEHRIRVTLTPTPQPRPPVRKKIK